VKCGATTRLSSRVSDRPTKLSQLLEMGELRWKLAALATGDEWVGTHTPCDLGCSSTRPGETSPAPKSAEVPRFVGEPDALRQALEPNEPKGAIFGNR
jgi:hypothetical protein